MKKNQAKLSVKKTLESNFSVTKQYFKRKTLHNDAHFTLATNR